MEFIKPDFEVGTKLAAVYKITFDGKWFYIGSSIHVSKRIIKWVCSLKLNKHFKSINIKKIIHPESIIEFELIEIVENLKDARDRENYHLSINWDNDFLLNRCPDAYTPKRMRKCIGYVKKVVIKGQPTKPKPIAQFDISGKLIATYKSILEASVKLRTKEKSISWILKGKKGAFRKTTFKEILPDGSYKEPPKFVAKYVGDKTFGERSKGKYIGGLSPCAKSIYMFTLDGVFIKEFASVRDAARAVKANAQNIHAVLSGRGQSCKGYKWKYST